MHMSSSGVLSVINSDEEEIDFKWEDPRPGLIEVLNVPAIDCSIHLSRPPGE
jgi:hypothetical protein